MAYDMMMFFRKTLRAKMPTGFLEDGGTIFFFKARSKTIVFECETDMFYSLMEKFAAEPIRV